MPETTKPKRTLSEDQLAKLKIAREKALAVKKEMKQKTDEGKIQHYEDKIQQLRSKYPPKEPEPEEVIKEENFELPPSPVPKAKPKSKGKKPVVICDESSSESDDASNVIYIRRKSSKKHKEPPQPPPLPPPPLPQREVVMNPNPFFRYNLNQHYM